MAGILDLVQQSLGPDAIQQISQQLGVDPSQAQSGVAAALPMLLSGLATHAQGTGADSIHAAVSQHDGSLLDDAAGFLGNTGGSPLGGLLGTVLGQHQDAAQGAVAAASGLGGAQAQQLLGMLAPLVMSAASRMQQQGGLDAGGLANLLGGEHQQITQALAQSQPNLLGLAESLLGGAAGGNAGGMLGNLEKGLGGLFGGQ